MDIQPTTIRLPRDLHERLRKESFERRRPMNQLILDRLQGDTATPEQFAQLCSLFEAAWHHVVPESLADLQPVTSTEARILSTMAWEIIRL